MTKEDKWTGEVSAEMQDREKRDHEAGCFEDQEIEGNIYYEEGGKPSSPEERR